MTRAPLGEALRRLCAVLEREHVDYLIYGGLALPAWGAVIATDDVDVVVRLTEGEGPRVLAALRAEGFTIPAAADRMLFIDTWTVATLPGREVDLSLGLSEFDAAALARAVRVELYGKRVPIASAEDLILYKLLSHRRKDLGHVETILVRQGRKLDLVYLRDWAARIAQATGKFEVPGVLETMLKEQGL